MRQGGAVATTCIVEGGGTPRSETVSPVPAPATRMPGCQRRPQPLLPGLGAGVLEMDVAFGLGGSKDTLSIWENRTLCWLCFYSAWHSTLLCFSLNEIPWQGITSCNIAGNIVSPNNNNLINRKMLPLPSDWGHMSVAWPGDFLIEWVFIT